MASRRSSRTLPQELVRAESRASHGRSPSSPEDGSESQKRRTRFFQSEDDQPDMVRSTTSQQEIVRRRTKSGGFTPLAKVRKSIIEGLDDDLLGLPKCEVDEFREAFTVFDRNGDGTITADEIGDVLRSLGRKPNMPEISRMIAEVDEDGSGEVDFDEFFHIMCSKLHESDTVEEMRDAFMVFDRDGNGRISAEELTQVMCNLGEQVTQDEIESMLSEADFDGDGALSFEDFMRYVQQEGISKIKRRSAFFGIS